MKGITKMKKFRILMGTLAFAMVAITVIACNKEKFNQTSNNSKFAVLSSESTNANPDALKSQQTCVLCEISYNDVSDSEKEDVMKHLSSLTTKKDANGYEIIGSIPIFDDTLNLVSYCMRQIGSESDYLVLTIDEETEALAYVLPTTISRNENEIYVVEVKNDNNSYFGASFEFNISDSTFYSVDGPICYGPTIGNNIAECVMIAVGSCFTDPGCALFCSGYPQYCLPAITLACTIHHLKGGASPANS